MMVHFHTRWTDDLRSNEHLAGTSYSIRTLPLSDFTLNISSLFIVGYFHPAQICTIKCYYTETNFKQYLNLKVSF